MPSLAILIVSLLAGDAALVLRNVRLFDGTGAAVSEPVSIVVRDGRIERIVPADAAVPVDVNELSEFAGKIVIPGLIDAHVHAFADEFDALFLAFGVTTVRDLGGDEKASLAHRAKSFTATDRPRTYVCGPIFDGSPPIWPFSVTPKNEDEARAEVDRLVKAGIDQVKVYSKLEDRIWRAIIDAAHAHGKKAIGHVPFGCTARDAVAAKQDEIEHLEGVADTCVIKDPRPSSVNDYLRRGSSNWNTADPACLEQLASELADAGTVSCPTLVVLERYARAGSPALAADPNLRHVPDSVRSWWDSQFARFDAPWGEAYRRDAQAAFEKRVAFVRMLHEAGAPIILGSDTPNPFVVPGASVHDELELLVRAGLSPADALVAATSAAAQAIEAERELGTIAPGKLADLVILDRDPTADIRNSRAIAAVVHRGHLMRKADLDARLATPGEAAAGVAPGASDELVSQRGRGKLIRRADYETTFGGLPSGSESASIWQSGPGLTIVSEVKSSWPSPSSVTYDVECDGEGALSSATIERRTGGERAIARYRVAGGRLVGEIVAASGSTEKLELALASKVALNGSCMALSYATNLLHGIGGKRTELLVDAETLRASLVSAEPGELEATRIEVPAGAFAGQRRKATIEMLGTRTPIEECVDESGLALALKITMASGAVEVKCVRVAGAER